MKRRVYLSDPNEVRARRNKQQKILYPDPELRVTAENAKKARRLLNITRENMANLCCVKKADVLRWEREGVWAYTDKEEGPAAIVYRMILSKKKSIQEEREWFLKEFGYNGPGKHVTKTIFMRQR
jgi:hypothetical protein